MNIFGAIIPAWHADKKMGRENSISVPNFLLVWLY
jgi:hypothetical protein